MSNRYLMVLLIACLASTEVRSAAEIRYASAHITFNLDAAGQPSGFACLPELAASICARVTAAASRWKYQAGMADGKPAEMRALMTLYLQGIPRSGGFELKASGASLREVGNPADDAAATRTVSVPPRYPKKAMRRGAQGLVVLEIWFEPGSDRLTVRNAWLDGQKPRGRSDLVDAAAAAVTTWKLGLHSSKVLSTCIPVEFKLYSRPSPLSGTAPCQPSYAAGYKSPELITKPEQMVF